MEFLPELRSEDRRGDGMKLKYYSGAQVMSIIEKLPSKEYFEMLFSFSEEPSADVAQVVRCKDCVHHINAPQTTDVWCERIDGLLQRNWFCADGERMEYDANKTD